MKKSIITISTVAMLGLGYLGATWYTGKVLEENIDSQLQSISQQINTVIEKANISDEVSIDIDEYQRGFFSSQFNVLVSVNTTQYFYDTITVQHGPFSFAQISHGSFLPKLATFIYNERPKESKDDAQLPNIVPYLSWGEGFVDLSYDGKINIHKIHIRYNGRSAPSTIDVNRNAYFIIIKEGMLTQDENSNTTLSWESATYTNAYQSLLSKNGYFSFTDTSSDSQETSTDVLTFKNELVEFTDDNSKINIDNIELLLNRTNKNDENKYHEGVTINLDQLSIIDRYDQKSLIEKMTLKNQQSLFGKQPLSGETSLSVQNALFSDVEWGSGEIAIHFKNYSMNSWISLLLFGYNRASPKAHLESEAEYPFGISLEKFEWNTPKGRLTASAELAFNDAFELAMDQLDHIQLDDEEDNKGGQQLASILNTFNYNADLSLDGLTYLYLIMDGTDSEDLTDAALFAETKEDLRQSIEEFTQEVLPMELSATTLTGNLQYDANQPTGTINGSNVESANLRNILYQLFTSLD